MSNHLDPHTHRALLGPRSGAKAEALCRELLQAEPMVQARAQTLGKAGSTGQPGGDRARDTQVRGQVRPEYSHRASEMQTGLSRRQTSSKDSLREDVLGPHIHC